MATQTVSATGGNFSATGTWVSGVVPLAGDDVVLNATSGQLTLDVTTPVLRSFICTGFTGTLTHNAAVTLNLGGSSAPVGNITLIFVGTETYTLGNATTSAIVITDTSGTANTCTFASKTIGNLTINNGTTTTTQVNSSYGQGSAATTTLSQGGFSITGGTFVSMGLFVRTSTTACTFNPGSSTIDINGTGTCMNISNTTNLTIPTNTATFVFTNSTINITAVGVNFNGSSISITSNAGVNWTNSTTIKNFTYAPTTPGTGNVFKITSGIAGITCTGNATFTGAASPNRVFVGSSVLSQTTTMTVAGTITASNVEFRDFTGAGAGSWNLSASSTVGDLGGNSGITFPAPQSNFYQAAANGLFSTAANWFLATNGAGGAGRVPLPQDTAVFDSNSGAHTYTLDPPRISSIDCTTFTGTILFPNSASQFYGNIAWGSGMTISEQTSSTLTLLGRGAQTITSNGKGFGNGTGHSTTLDCASGSYTLQDNFKLGTFNFTFGTFNANGHDVTAPIFDPSGVSVSFPVVINMGSGTWHINNSVSGQTGWSFGTTTGVTLNAQTSTISWEVSGTGGTWNFSGGGLTYNNFVWGSSILQTQTLIILGSSTFNQFTCSGNNAARTIELTSGTTQTANQFNLAGVAGNLLTINAVTSGSAATLSQASGRVVGSFLSLKDNTATGGAAFYAGTTSTIGTNVTGWLSSNAPSGTPNFLMMGVG